MATKPMRVLLALLTSKEDPPSVTYSVLRTRYGVEGKLTDMPKTLNQLFAQVAEWQGVERWEVVRKQVSPTDSRLTLKKPKTRRKTAKKIAQVRLARAMLAMLSDVGMGSISELLPAQSNHGDKIRHLDRMFFDVPFAQARYGREHQRTLAVAVEAIYNQELLEFDYKKGSSGELKRRVVHPLSVVSCDGALYVICEPTSSYGTYKTFALSRMSKAASNPSNSREYPADYQPERLLDGAFGIYQSEGKDIEVELLFEADNPYLHTYVEERDWHPTQEITPLKSGELQLRMKVKSMKPLWAWIRSFGDSVELIKPENTEVPTRWGA